MKYDICVKIKDLKQLDALLNEKDFENKRVYIPASPALLNDFFKRDFAKNELYLCSPYVLRKKDYPLFFRALKSGVFNGALIRSLEALSYLNENYEEYGGLNIVLDSNMYILNSEAFAFYKKATRFNIKEYYSSFELTGGEIARLNESIKEKYDSDVINSSVVYGRVPTMVSANCVYKTLYECKHKRGFYEITDRLNKEIPVLRECDFCYNITYNPVPLSLHKAFLTLLDAGNARLDFTDEDPDTVMRIYKYFNGLLREYKEPFYKEYTTGHYKRITE